MSQEGQLDRDPSNPEPRPVVTRHLPPGMHCSNARAPGPLAYFLEAGGWALGTNRGSCRPCAHRAVVPSVHGVLAPDPRFGFVNRALGWLPLPGRRPHTHCAGAAPVWPWPPEIVPRWQVRGASEQPALFEVFCLAAGRPGLGTEVLGGGGRAGRGWGPKGSCALRLVAP